MSRNSINHPIKKHLTLAYGLDHVTGYFYQIFDATKKDDEDLVEEKDMLFPPRLTKEELVSKMQEFNAPIDHIDRVVLDLDIM
jgi:hypothetical protein